MARPLADRVDVNDHGTIVFEGASAALPRRPARDHIWVPMDDANTMVSNWHHDVREGTGGARPRRALLCE